MIQKPHYNDGFKTAVCEVLGFSVKNVQRWKSRVRFTSKMVKKKAGQMLGSLECNGKFQYDSCFLRRTLMKKAFTYKKQNQMKTYFSFLIKLGCRQTRLKVYLFQQAL